jgi:hypothetical protein
MKYRIAHSQSLQDLPDQVNSLCKENGEPQGGLLFAEGIYYQAMVQG